MHGSGLCVDSKAFMTRDNRPLHIGGYIDTNVKRLKSAANNTSCKPLALERSVEAISPVARSRGQVTTTSHPPAWSLA